MRLRTSSRPSCLRTEPRRIWFCCRTVRSLADKCRTGRSESASSARSRDTFRCSSPASDVRSTSSPGPTLELSAGPSTWRGTVEATSTGKPFPSSSWGSSGRQSGKFRWRSMFWSSPLTFPRKNPRSTPSESTATWRSWRRSPRARKLFPCRTWCRGASGMKHRWSHRSSCQSCAVRPL